MAGHAAKGKAPVAMKVDPLTAARSPAVRRGARITDQPASSFAQELEGETPAARAGGCTVGVVESLLVLQEVPHANSANRQARRRGEDLLDRLEELRLAILLGTLSRGTLERLSAMLAIRQDSVNDPRLAEVLAEIELRAAVELAKLRV